MIFVPVSAHFFVRLGIGVSTTRPKRYLGQFSTVASIIVVEATRIWLLLIEDRMNCQLPFFLRLCDGSHSAGEAKHRLAFRQTTTNSGLKFVRNAGGNFPHHIGRGASGCDFDY